MNLQETLEFLNVLVKLANEIKSLQEEKDKIQSEVKTLQETMGEFSTNEKLSALEKSLEQAIMALEEKLSKTPDLTPIIALHEQKLAEMKLSLSEALTLDMVENRLKELKQEISSLMPETLTHTVIEKITEVSKELSPKEKAELKKELLTPNDIVDSLESLEGDARLDRKAIKGLEKITFKEDLDRAVSILDNRTNFLLSKINNLDIPSITVPGTGDEFIYNNNGELGAMTAWYNGTQYAFGEEVYSRTFNVTGDGFVVRNSAGDKAYRARFGGATDFEFTGDAYFSNWGAADFTGSQYQQFIMKADGTPTQWLRSINFNNGNSGDQDYRFKGQNDDDTLFVDVSADSVGFGTATPTAKVHVVGDLKVDNLKLDGNTISITDTNGDLFLKANGTGGVGIGEDATVSDDYAIAIGRTSTASGGNSIAIGSGNGIDSFGAEASGDFSLALGSGSLASGTNSNAIGGTATSLESLALGVGSLASGNRAVAIGNVTSKSFNEIVVGANPVDYTPDSTTAWDADDRLFVVGNGATGFATSNALTMLKNGKTGFLGITSPTAIAHLPAGTTTVAPLKIDAGTNLTSPEAGAVEFDGTNLFYTTSTPTRKTLATTDDIPDNLTDFVSQTAWRLFYSNGSGDVTELALGAARTIFKASGTAAAPSFQESRYFTMPFTTSRFSPADSTSYYLSQMGATIASPASQADNVDAVPMESAMTKVVLNIWVATTLATSETANVYVRVNNTTDHLLGTTTFDSAKIQKIFTPAIALNAGDLVQIKVTMPAFSTNPTNVYMWGLMICE